MQIASQVVETEAQARLRGLEETQRATLNILEDFDAERKGLEHVQRAILNILEDFEAEKNRLELGQRATLNILEDFDSEKTRLELGQRATLNILEDFNAEKASLEQSQRASLNILEDFEAERIKVEIANQNLASVNRELEAASLAKSRFLASMSHELRTPLNAIIGFTGTLLMRLAGPLSAEQERQLRTIQTSSKHLLSLINDLLDVARIESGRVTLTLEDVVCQEVLEEIATTLRPLAEAKQLRFELRLPEKTAVVRADSRTLRQILINLANNAIKFTEQGEVRMELMQRPENGGAVTEITVADTGVGIRDEDKERLFQAFTQVGGFASRPEGTGLGLYLSHKLAELLGGSIQFESVYGRGSTFRVILPPAGKEHDGAHPGD